MAEHIRHAMRDAHDEHLDGSGGGKVHDDLGEEETFFRRAASMSLREMLLTLEISISKRLIAMLPG